MNNTTDDSLAKSGDLNTIFMILNFSTLSAMVITLVTNVITVIVMVTTPKLRTRTNAFIVSLAVSDIIFVLFWCISFSIYVAVPETHFNVAAVTFAWEVLILGNYGNLFLVSLERWMYITKPFLYQLYVTTRAVIGSIATTWIIALGGTFLNRLLKIGFLTYVIPTIHTAFFFALLTIYTHICLITLKHLKKLPKAGQQGSRQIGRNGNLPKAKIASSLHAKNWKSIKLLISICGIFFMSVSPFVYFTSYILITNSYRRNPDLILLMICFLLLSVFHCSNFFVYALGIPLFRKTLRTRFCRLRCCRGPKGMKGLPLCMSPIA